MIRCNLKSLEDEQQIIFNIGDNLQQPDIHIKCSEWPRSNDKTACVLQHWNRECVLAHVIVTIHHHLCVCLVVMCATTMPPGYKWRSQTDDLTMVTPIWWISEYYFWSYSARYIYDLTGHEESITMKFQLLNDVFQLFNIDMYG